MNANNFLKFFRSLDVVFFFNRRGQSDLRRLRKDMLFKLRQVTSDFVHLICILTMIESGNPRKQHSRFSSCHEIKVVQYI